MLWGIRMLCTGMLGLGLRLRFFIRGLEKFLRFSLGGLGLAVGS